MLFWIFVTVIALLVVALMVRPLWLDERGGAGEVDALDVYKRQLRELEQEVEAGTIPAAEAEATRLEIERRLLAADRELQLARSTPTSLSKRQRILVTVLMALALPVTSLMLYWTLGAPGYSDLPHASRCQEIDSAAELSDPDMARLIDCLAVRMDENPVPDGLVMLGGFYMNGGRFAEASQVFARAIELGGPTIAALEGLGVAIIYLNQGDVTDSARAAFMEAVKLEGDTTFARFYLAEYDYQHGKPIEALSAWVDLLEVTPRNNPIFGVIDARINQAIAEQEAAVGQLGEAAPPVAQSDRVKAMVAGLAARLEENPHDLEGWLMLIRSYHVQGRGDEARAALSKASLIFVADPGALRQIIALDEELSLSPKLEVPLEPAP
ncbi:MAG: c-type cytochrome biogenesis protein CcmI [Alphaproteobacteria bacterium]|nr:MAG: c-type cytochrome biogenesis protein CcmI [Alphaproteobacteria bacterium]